MSLSLRDRARAAWDVLTNKRSWSPLDDRWYTGWASGPTKSGVIVDEDTSLQVVAVYACVNVLASDLASLPLFVYRNRPPREKEHATDLAIYHLLHDRPNQEQSSFIWRQTLMAHCLLWGNLFCEIEFGSDGEPAALWPVPPWRVKAKRTLSRELFWEINFPRSGSDDWRSSGGIVYVPDYAMFRVAAMGTTGLTGLSPIRQAIEAIGLSKGAEEFGARLFGQGANMGAVIEHPKALSQEGHKNLESSLNENYAGLGKSHRLMLLEEGMKWAKVGIAPNEAQFLESRKFQALEIARLFRVPPHMIMDLDRATFCLPADVEVYTESGPKSISLIESGEKVWSLGADNKWVLGNVNKSSYTGEDGILEIKTTNRTIRANARHRIFVRRKYPEPEPGIGKYQHNKWVNEWMPAGDLKVGDTIITLKKLPNTDSTQIPTRRATVGLMEFLGLYLGDGYKTKGHITIARNKNSSYFEHYRNVIKAEFICNDGGNGRQNSNPAVKPVHLVEAERYARFASVKASLELDILGFSGTAHTKKVPGWVYNISDELKLAFLRGYLDADGSIDKKGRISYSSCNQVMLSQIRHLCMSLGIPVTNIRCQDGYTTLPNGRKTTLKQYGFTCSNPGENSRIGSHDKRYIERLENGKPFSKKGRNYPRFGGIGFDLKDCELSRIVSIKDQDEEAVYDLEVGGTHSFVANGVIVHNSNIEQQGIGYVVHTLRPWLVNWEQELNAKLLRYRQGYFAEFSVEGLLRGDSAARAAFYKEMFFVGAMSPNDIRNKENLNPVDGGDRYYVPLNMVPVGGEGEPAFSEPGVNGIATPSPAAGFPIRSGMTGPGEQRKRRGAVARARAARAGRHGFEEAGTRIVEREKSNVLRAAKKHLGERSLEGWNSWLDDFYRDFPDFIVRQVGGAVLALAELIQPMAAEEVNGEEGMSAEMERFLVEYKRSFALRYRDSSKGQLRSIVDRAEMDPEADPVEVVEMRLGEWEQRRPGKVALNESIVLSNAVAKLVFVDAGITRLRWAAIGGESCPFCQEMDGKIVGVEQPFVAHDTVLQAEGKSDMKIYKPALHPPLHEGCVCQVEPE